MAVSRAVLVAFVCLVGCGSDGGGGGDDVANECGDGVVAGSEECDDGNIAADDGCTACHFDCTTDAQCSDSNVCNGSETCGANHICAPGTPPTCSDSNACTTDACDAVMGCTFTLIDNDGDGAAPMALGSCGTDCNDNDPNIHPGATEAVGDEVDQNFDGIEQCFLDADGDSYRVTAAVVSNDIDCTDVGEARASTPAGDCDDNVMAIHPGAMEVVGDGVDQNCDSGETCYADADNDGYRLTTTVMSSDLDCADSGEAVASDPTGDCNDAVMAIHPGATEIVGDNVDENCDGGELCYRDNDADGYRVATVITSADADCVDVGEAEASDPAGDCDDMAFGVHPGATENPGNNLDEDCDGTELCYADADNDGFRLNTTIVSVDPDCNDSGEGTSSDPPGDCNDGVFAINPNATEVCFNSTDDNCDMQQDEAPECSIDCNWAGARWLSHGWDSTNATATGAYLTCTNSKLAYVQFVVTSPPGVGVSPPPAGTADPIVGCNWSAATRWASQGFDSSLAFTRGATVACNSTRVTGISWEQDAVAAGTAMPGQLGCNWTGAIFLSHGHDGTCAFQTGFQVTCNNNHLTNFAFVETAGCPRARN